MKDSGIEWIGEIPQNWEICRLRYLCFINTGDKDTVNKVDNGNFPFYVRSPKIERINSYSFDGEAILMAGDGVGAGKVFHYVNGKFDFHQRVYNFHHFKRIKGKLLYFYLQSNFEKKMQEGNAKSTVDSVRLPMLLNFAVCTPSFEEQQIIIKFLDYKIADIDELIALQGKMIEELKAYKQSIITEAIIKGIDPTVSMKDSGVEWIGNIPSKWKIGRIKNVIELNPRLQININITNKDMVSFVPMECLRNGAIAKKLETFQNVSNYTPFVENDVIMAKVTPCFENGNIAIASNLENGLGFGSSEIFVFRTKKEINNLYLFYLLQTNYFRNIGISSMTGTGGLKRVNPSTVNNTKIILPTFEEQQAIANYLDCKTSEIEGLITIKQQKTETLKEYKKSLIFEYVTGKKQVE